MLCTRDFGTTVPVSEQNKQKQNQKWISTFGNVTVTSVTVTPLGPIVNSTLTILAKIKLFNFFH